MIIHLFDDAQKVTVEEGVCVCGAQLVNVEYKQVSLIQCSLWHVNYFFRWNVFTRANVEVTQSLVCSNFSFLSHLIDRYHG